MSSFPLSSSLRGAGAVCRDGSPFGVPSHVLPCTPGNQTHEAMVAQAAIAAHYEARNPGAGGAALMGDREVDFGIEGLGYQPNAVHIALDASDSASF
jgi:hypothetical protein